MKGPIPSIGWHGAVLRRALRRYLVSLCGALQPLRLVGRAMFSNLWSAALAYYGAAIVSAVVPWVNAELLMISAIPLADSRGALAALVVAVSAGQMTGKTFMYWASRKSHASVYADGAARGRSVACAIAAESPIGPCGRFCQRARWLSPFFIVSVAAGALGVEFRHFSQPVQLAVSCTSRLWPASRSFSGGRSKLRARPRPSPHSPDDRPPC